jgi:hypothetical protein
MCPIVWLLVHALRHSLVAGAAGVAGATKAIEAAGATGAAGAARAAGGVGSAGGIGFAGAAGAGLLELPELVHPLELLERRISRMFSIVLSADPTAVLSGSILNALFLLHSAIRSYTMSASALLLVSHSFLEV